MCDRGAPTSTSTRERAAPNSASQDAGLGPPRAFATLRPGFYRPGSPSVRVPRPIRQETYGDMGTHIRTRVLCNSSLLDAACPKPHKLGEKQTLSHICANPVGAMFADPLDPRMRVFAAPISTSTALETDGLGTPCEPPTAEHIGPASRRRRPTTGLGSRPAASIQHGPGGPGSVSLDLGQPPDQARDL